MGDGLQDLTESQAAIVEAGRLPDEIRYQEHVGTFDLLAVLHDENRALIETLRGVIQERDQAIKDMPHNCATCRYKIESASFEKCMKCRGFDQVDDPPKCWEWHGFSDLRGKGGANAE